jgi:hypothetical protein
MLQEIAHRLQNTQIAETVLIHAAGIAGNLRRQDADFRHRPQGGQRLMVA